MSNPISVEDFTGYHIKKDYSVVRLDIKDDDGDKLSLEFTPGTAHGLFLMAQGLMDKLGRMDSALLEQAAKDREEGKLDKIERAAVINPPTVVRCGVGSVSDGRVGIIFQSDVYAPSVVMSHETAKKLLQLLQRHLEASDN